MYLKKLSLINFKNIREENLDWPSSRKKSLPWRMLCPSVIASDDLHIER